MKNFILLFILSVLTIAVKAQSPQAINYQAVARDNSGNPLTNRNIGVRVGILSGSSTGTSVYSETHNVTTNQFGLFNIEIGRGVVQSGVFAQINWGSNTHFAKIDIDQNGGTNFQFVGTSQMLSVPYSLYAENIAMQFGVFWDNQDTIKVYKNSSINSFTKPDVNWLGGEPENLTINTNTLPSGVTISPGFPRILPSSDFLNYGYAKIGDPTISINNSAIAGNYSIEYNVSNNRGKTRKTSFILSIQSSCFQQEDKLNGRYKGNLSYTNGGGIDSLSWNYYYDTIGIYNTSFSDCILDQFSDKIFYSYINNLSLPTGGSTFSTSNVSVGNVNLCYDQNCNSYDSYIQNAIVNYNVINISPNSFTVTINVVSGVFKTTDSYLISKGYNNKNCSGAKFTGTYTKV